MADVLLISGSDRTHQNRYDTYQFGRSSAARTADAADGTDPNDPLQNIGNTQPVQPVDVSPYAGFFTFDAMGLNAFTPNGGSAIDQINQALQISAPAVLNPDMAVQLLGLQTDTTPPTQDNIDGAMAALAQNYNVDAGPVALFKQINTNHSGTIQPWDLTQAVLSGGGTIEQASALMKQLDPFGNGYVTVQNMMANLPGVTPPEGTDTSTQPQTDNTALGGLGALATKYNVSSTDDVFQQLDTDYDGVLTQSDIVNAVTSAGGSADAGAALYAQLDPANTGSVTQAQFSANLLPRIEVPSFFA